MDHSLKISVLKDNQKFFKSFKDSFAKSPNGVEIYQLNNFLSYTIQRA